MGAEPVSLHAAPEDSARKVRRFALPGIEDHEPLWWNLLGLVAGIVVLLFFEPITGRTGWMVIIALQAGMILVDPLVPRHNKRLLATIRIMPGLSFALIALMVVPGVFSKVISAGFVGLSLLKPLSARDGYVEVLEDRVHAKSFWYEPTVPFEKIGSVRTPHSRLRSLLRNTGITIVILFKKEPKQLWPWRHRLSLNVQMDEVPAFLETLERRMAAQGMSLTRS